MSKSATAPATDAPAVRVMGQGTLEGNGLPFVLVSSSSEPGRVHVCAYSYEGVFVGSRMQCDCTAASFGKSCKHVLVARAWLAGAASATRGTRGTHAAPERWGGRSQAPFSMMAR